jgi:pimeloyl-ACP methyl ester carboxylesterase
VSATSDRNAGSARPARFELSSGPIAALQSGPSGGAPVLLVPGFTGSKEDFGPLLDPLGAAGFGVTAIDLPGQVESPGLPTAADYTPQRLGAVVREVAARLGERVLLLGHSFGGLVARAAVIAEPSRFASLVLLCSGPAALPGARRAALDRLEPLLATAGLPGVYAALQSAAAGTPGYVPPPPEVAEFIERRFLGSAPEMYVGMAAALRTEPDRVAELAAAGRPMLVLHGRDDDAWPPAQQREMAQRLGARYEVVPDAAHSPNVENPAATARSLLEFWPR